MIALFGNVAPLDGDTSYERVTTVEFPELHSVEDAVRDVVDPQGVWVAHSSAPPSWVASDSPELVGRRRRRRGRCFWEPRRPGR